MQSAPFFRLRSAEAPLTVRRAIAPRTHAQRIGRRRMLTFSKRGLPCFGYGTPRSPKRGQTRRSDPWWVSTRRSPQGEESRGVAAALCAGAECAGKSRPPAPRSGARDGRLNGNPRQLFDRRQPRRNLRQAVVPERPHALGNRRTLDVLAARLRHRKALHRLAHLEQLVDADPALVARLPAPWAAALAVERHPVRGCRDLRGHARVQELVNGRRVEL